MSETLIANGGSVLFVSWLSGRPELRFSFAPELFRVDVRFAYSEEFCLSRRFVVATFLYRAGIVSPRPVTLSPRGQSPIGRSGSRHGHPIQTGLGSCNPESNLLLVEDDRQ